MIESLTPAQQNQVSLYQEKWQRVVYETTPINVESATTALHQLAQVLDIPTVKTVEVVASPFVLLTQPPVDLTEHQRILRTIGSLVDRLSSELKRQMGVGLWVELWRSLEIQTLDPMEDALWLGVQEDSQKQEQLIASVQLEGKRHFITRIDFCINELGCACDRQAWEAIRLWATNCSFLRWTGSGYQVSDRPQTLTFDEQGQLHGVEEPAIVYRNNAGVYVDRGSFIKH